MMQDPQGTKGPRALPSCHPQPCASPRRGLCHPWWAPQREGALICSPEPPVLTQGRGLGNYFGAGGKERSGGSWPFPPDSGRWHPAAVSSLKKGFWFWFFFFPTSVSVFLPALSA